MSLSIYCIGKIKFKPYRISCDEYLKRLKHYVPVSEFEIKGRGAAKFSEEENRRLESEDLLKLITPSSFLFVLDERGSTLSSTSFAQKLEELIQLSRPVSFVIGGALGHHDCMRKSANALLSLSSLTFPHELARVILLEQIYRAMTILKNEPYHK